MRQHSEAVSAQTAGDIWQDDATISERIEYQEKFEDMRASDLEESSREDII